MKDADAIIIGAGPAGLACSVCMRAFGVTSAVVEKDLTVGSVWRRHYDRLHLHTDRSHSGLPNMAMPRDYPKYPSRDQLVRYLEDYTRHFRIEPKFGVTVKHIQRAGRVWKVDTSGQSLSAPIVVVATGLATYPVRPSWPGRSSYQGNMIHSSEYKNPDPYLGKKVLIVGFGNSGGEIALDLANANIDVTLAIRGPVQILPRELLGIPILTWGIALGHLPARIADFVSTPILQLAVGSLEKYGMQRAPKGPRRMIEDDGRVPLLDVGTLGKIRDGSIRVLGEVRELTSTGVFFSDKHTIDFDAIILATGFYPDLRGLLPKSTGVLNDQGAPLVTGKTTKEAGLYFCGQTPSATGQLREIGLEARNIGRLSQQYLEQYQPSAA